MPLSLAEVNCQLEPHPLDQDSAKEEVSLSKSVLILLTHLLMGTTTDMAVHPLSWNCLEKFSLNIAHTTHILCPLFG